MLTPNASCTLYLQTAPYQYRRIFCPSVFWQENADGTSVIIPEDLPEQYKDPQEREQYARIKRAVALEKIDYEAEYDEAMERMSMSAG